MDAHSKRQSEIKTRMIMTAVCTLMSAECVTLNRFRHIMGTGCDVCYWLKPSSRKSFHLLQK